MENKVAAYDVHIFIQDKFKLRPEEVISIGIYGNKVMLKVLNAEIMENIFNSWENKLEYIDSSGKCHVVKLSNESLKNVVRIHRIAIEIPDSEIKKALSAYGVNETINNDTWKNLPYACYNDIKIVKMEIHRSVPSYVRILGKQYWTTYIGQLKTCRRCDSTEHEARDCVLSAENRIRTRNYASALTGQLRKQYLSDKDSLMEDNFTILNETAGTRRILNTKEASVAEGNMNRQSNTTSRQKEIEKTNQTKSHITTDLNVSTEERQSKTTEKHIGNASNLESHTTFKIGHVNTVVPSSRQNDQGTEGIIQVEQGKKRGKIESSDSGGESNKPVAKKINWADEIDNIEGATRMVQEPSQTLIRTSSEESSY